MTLQFDKASHTYTLDGVRVPHVTGILEVLGNVYSGIPADVLEAAAERGDAVHFATELFDLGELDEDSLPETVAPYLSAWKLFRASTGFEPVDIESRVFHPLHKYAGTLDRTGVFKNLKGVKPTQLCVVDIKATANLMPTVGPQTAAYAMAYQAGTGKPIAHRMSVQLKKDGTFNLETHADRADSSVFLAALCLYRWREINLKEKKTC